MEPSAVGPAIALASILLSAFAAYLVRRQDRRDNLERYERDERRHARELEEAKAEANRVEQSVAARALELAKNLELAAENKRLRDEKDHRETLKLLAATHASVKAAALGADRAYSEANALNAKIAAATDTVLILQAQLAEVIARGEVPPAPPSGTELDGGVSLPIVEAPSARP